MDGEAQAEVGAGEDVSVSVSVLAEGRDGVGAVRRAERGEGDAELAVGDVDVGGGAEELVEEGAALVVGAGVVRAEQGEEVALGLVGDHLDEVGEVLALGGELDDGARR